MKLIICALLIATGKFNRKAKSINLLVKLMSLVGAKPLNISDENVIEPIVKEADWRLIPDSDYKLHLIDINAVDLGIEPAFVGVNDIIFRLFTLSNLTPQIIQIFNDDQLRSTNFNFGHQTRFHIHGWLQAGPNTADIYRDAYLARGNFNVIAVDWGVGAQDPNYIAARNRVAEVGRTVAQFIDWLNELGHPFSAVTVIGLYFGNSKWMCVSVITQELLKIYNTKLFELSY